MLINFDVVVVAVVFTVLKDDEGDDDLIISVLDNAYVCTDTHAVGHIKFDCHCIILGFKMFQDGVRVNTVKSLFIYIVCTDIGLKCHSFGENPLHLKIQKFHSHNRRIYFAAVKNSFQKLLPLTILYGKQRKNGSLPIDT